MRIAVVYLPHVGEKDVTLQFSAAKRRIRTPIK